MRSVHENKPSEHDESEVAHASPESEEVATKFVGGHSPPVAADVKSAQRATASELAFGEPTRDREKLVAAVASAFHEQWRAPRFDAKTGRHEPRVKTTKDEAWSKQHGGATEVDIANTAYADLPTDWQAENRASAEVAVDLVLAAERSHTPLDANFIEQASATVHVKWLERNPWAPDNQKLPYADLTEAEKQKDRDVVNVAIKLFRS